MDLKVRIEQLRNPVVPDNSLEIEVLEQWPDTVDAPTCLSNLSNDLRSYTGHGVLHWTYPRERPDLILRALEDSGWSVAIVSLVRWNQYLPSVYPAGVESVPETIGTYKLNECSEILSLHVKHYLRCPSERRSVLSVWMNSPKGKTYRVDMKWRFRAGYIYMPPDLQPHTKFAVLRLSDAVFNLEGLEAGTHVAQISAQSKCRSIPGTSMSVDGVTYWEPICEHDQWASVPASHFVSQILIG
mgnify:CR=1 FL=1